MNESTSAAALPRAYERIFLPPDSAGVFRDSTWESVLIPKGLNMDAPYSEALCRAVRAAGDDEIVITDFNTRPPHHDTRRNPAEPTRIKQLWSGTILGHLDVRLVGSSGSWGGETAWEGLLLIGGAPVFMKRLLALTGGTAMLQKEFEAFREQEGWLGGPDAARLVASARWPSGH